MTKTTASKWRDLIEAQEKSGLTVREFADLRGIVATTLYWWRSKLRRKAGDLVPVEVIERNIVVGSGRRQASAFELQVDDATTWRIPAGFDEAELRRLIRALRC
jgi:phosphoribosylaminoimidazole-succinocarboxamide synthase